MHKYICFLMFVASIILSTSVFANTLPIANLHTLVGHWHNIDSKNPQLDKITITQHGNTYKINVWGSCHDKVCDWGNVKLNHAFPHGLKPWDPQYKIAYISFNQYTKNIIGIAIYNVFTKYSHKPGQLIETLLQKTENK